MRNLESDFKEGRQSKAGALKFVDVSGFGHSGKTAVSDFIKQHDSVFSFSNSVEFELFRVPGGLLDLYFSIYASWSLIRSTARIDDFKKLVGRIGEVPAKSKPLSYFRASGHAYDNLFNGSFITISNDFIDELVSFSNVSFWPYENLRMSSTRLFEEKIKYKITGSFSNQTINYSNRKHFLQKVAAYMQALFNEVVAEGQNIVLLNNAFEPFNPSAGLDMAGNALSIIVERDPRDIYASQINPNEGFKPEFENKKNTDSIKKQLTGFDDNNLFINRYRSLMENVTYGFDTRVLRIRYEDFVLKHEEWAKKILSFVQMPFDAKIIKRIFFAEDSQANVGIWKKYKDLPEIKKIEEKLADYCYQE